MNFNRRDILNLSLFASSGTALLGLGACKAATVSGSSSKTQLRKTKVTKGYVDGPFGQVHYYEAGVGPAVILSHQSPTSARMFERIMQPLSAYGLRVIAVDTPGYGNSDTPTEPPMIADYADTFLSVLKNLNLNKAHFLGHHTGAAILCNFAARYPNKVSSLILNGPPLLSAEDIEKFSGVELAPKPIDEDGSHLLDAWNRRASYSVGWTDKVAMHRRLVDSLWAGDTDWYGHNAVFKYDMKVDALAIKVPTLILTNTGDDIYENALRLKALRPDFDYVELKGGTHDIVDERPIEWSAAVANFIANV